MEFIILSKKYQINLLYSLKTMKISAWKDLIRKSLFLTFYSLPESEHKFIPDDEKTLECDKNTVNDIQNNLNIVEK